MRITVVVTTKGKVTGRDFKSYQVETNFAYLMSDLAIVDLDSTNKMMGVPSDETYAADIEYKEVDEISIMKSVLFIYRNTETELRPSTAST